VPNSCGGSLRVNERASEGGAPNETGLSLAGKYRQCASSPSLAATKPTASRRTRRTTSLRVTPWCHPHAELLPLVRKLECQFWAVCIGSLMRIGFALAKNFGANASLTIGPLAARPNLGYRNRAPALRT
jgi:hypothetical protein